MRTTKRGLWGEGLAAKYLQSSGYTIVERNWRWRKLEIDLIARLHDEWVFIEVKTRKKGYLASALEAVDLHKQQRIIEASHHFIQRATIIPRAVKPPQAYLLGQIAPLVRPKALALATPKG